MIDDFDYETSLKVLDSRSIEQVEQFHGQSCVSYALQQASDGRIIEEHAVLMLEATVVRMEVQRQACLAVMALPQGLAPSVEVVGGHS